MIPYLLTYCKLTNETYTDAMRESVMQVFIIVNYEVERIEKENRRMKAMMHK